MAISFAKYPYADITNIATALQTALNGTGLFTSVTVTEDDSDKVVTAVMNEATYLTITLSDIEEICEFKNGDTLGVIHTDTTSSDAVWVGTVGTSVIFSFQTSSAMASVVVMESTDGLCMTASVGIQNHRMSAFSEDSQTTYYDSYTPVTGTKWVSLLGIAADSESKNAAFAKSVFRLFAIQNGLIDIYAQGAEYKKFVLDGYTYLTDGYFCLKDEEG